MAYTQSQIDALKAAIATGTLRVETPGVAVVTYRSVADMQKILADMQRDVNAAAGAKTIRRVKTYVATKDL